MATIFTNLKCLGASSSGSLSVSAEEVKWTPRGGGDSQAARGREEQKSLIFGARRDERCPRRRWYDSEWYGPSPFV